MSHDTFAKVPLLLKVMYVNKRMEKIHTSSGERKILKERHEILCLYINAESVALIAITSQVEWQPYHTINLQHVQTTKYATRLEKKKFQEVP